MLLLGVCGVSAGLGFAAVKCRQWDLDSAVAAALVAACAALLGNALNDTDERMKEVEAGTAWAKIAAAFFALGVALAVV